MAPSRAKSNSYEIEQDHLTQAPRGAKASQLGLMINTASPPASSESWGPASEPHHCMELIFIQLMGTGSSVCEVGPQDALAGASL